MAAEASSANVIVRLLTHGCTEGFKGVDDVSFASVLTNIVGNNGDSDAHV